MLFARVVAVTSTSRRGSVVLVGASLALSLLLTACGGDDEGGDGSPGDATNTAAAPLLEGAWPLTGEPLDGDLPEHPVYVVKVDNTSNAEPQIGLSHADLVVEELVEGGLTRLAAFYYSDVPEVVGPVRSMRASDVGIVTPAGATLVAAGGAKKTRKVIAAAEISTPREGGPGFYRVDDRSAPYNLFMHLGELSGDPEKGWEPPAAPYFTFGDSSDFPGRIPVKKMVATFSGAAITHWNHTDKGWVRTDSLAKAGDDYIADNVLVLSLKVGDAGYLDPAGHHVPETFFYGKGKALLLHGDRAVKATWTKADADSQLKLTTADGKEVAVPVGHTFIELLPARGGHVALTK